MISKGEKTPELHTASHRKIERLGLGKITALMDIRISVQPPNARGYKRPPYAHCALPPGMGNVQHTFLVTYSLPVTFHMESGVYSDKFDSYAMLRCATELEPIRQSPA